LLIFILKVFIIICVCLVILNLKFSKTYSNEIEV